jgi:hypothetical protein
MDLELMHHYTVNVYLTLSRSPIEQLLWRDDVVMLALGCDYVTHALLAVSAVHLALNRSDRRDQCLAAAFSHHSLALEAAKPLLADMKVVDARNLFLFSSLTIYFGEFAVNRRYSATPADLQ